MLEIGLLFDLQAKILPIPLANYANFESPVSPGNFMGSSKLLSMVRLKQYFMKQKNLTYSYHIQGSRGWLINL